MTQADVDAFLLPVIRMAFFLGCSGSTVLLWAIVIRRMRHDPDEVGDLIVMALACTLVFVVMMCVVWYTSLPATRAQ